MRYDPPDDYDDIRREAAWVKQKINKLRHRAGLHHMDPDALDEDERAELEELENWTP
jgi:hypothetical protein